MIDYITQEIEKVCPIYGVNTDGEISYNDSATIEQRQAAYSLYASLTTSEAINAYERTRMLREYDIAIEKHLDHIASDAGYYDPLSRIPNIDRACSYAGFENEYQAESQSFIAWRASVWSCVYNIKSEVEAGNRTQPSIEELIAELPQRT